MPTTTTLAAFHMLKAGPLKLQILELIESAGPDGCIHEDIRAVFPMDTTKDGTLNTRYSELERASMIFRNGETRPGASGRDQLVLRHAKFASNFAGLVLPTCPTPAPKSGKGFLAGMIYASRIVAKAADFSTARAALTHELSKAASR